MKFLNKVKSSLAALVMGVVLFSVAGVASAAIPLAATDAFAALLVDMLAIIDLVWTVVVPVTIGFILIRMFKKGAASAS
ncbi:MAG: hypothetical protein GQ532_06220 [Methylomarinum sp.]|nr:hypothetical protein [Methylomarinum sp.]